MSIVVNEICPPFSTWYGYCGAAAAIIFANLGSAYGTVTSGMGVCSIGPSHPNMVMKGIVPTIMAGILCIYGLIVAIIINSSITKEYTYFQGFAHLSAGLMAGLSALCAGIAIGVVGEAGVRSYAREPKLFVGMLLILIFGEALALYGLIVGLIVGTKTPQNGCDFVRV
ncbi:putative V-type H+-transporting ATPase subunit c [Monocercomonoides exilis]|uniref:putative V-type H+-transporting ATPase subunit c n=1 Tax=Monocercomonoides exilis TaxID=2049356 RepID=UPI00355A72B6|nr:putative V-type H+-transporting ATPase subunit c [Monocercomonoides exilis]KAH7825322.1 putative V-type H+-transporting ATPase subunit c [Monocercomonoides exilis]|eukprot:MONOS_590.1-p1 / transcript=MONOS_590.1 / gene=MONOS_590 / organism=Monocercomonoides_exilis_PA203 / gene_product=V-type H / transcript_product=V-type H / location=Mono_scaffold00009:206771-207521(-) / protein_length=168 / sequence_SO=supercontig / SO=protein_coding / is_pseudo=false